MVDEVSSRSLPGPHRSIFFLRHPLSNFRQMMCAREIPLKCLGNKAWIMPLLVRVISLMYWRRGVERVGGGGGRWLGAEGWGREKRKREEGRDREIGTRGAGRDGVGRRGERGEWRVGGEKRGRGEGRDGREG